MWYEANGIDCPINSPMVISSATIETNEEKQAPSMGLDTVRQLGQRATIVQIRPYKRAFVSGILLMAYASIRFAEVRRLRPFGTNEDSSRGNPLWSKTKKPRGQNWHWARPILGIAGAKDWPQPLLDMRADYAEINGREMAYDYPRLDHTWSLAAEGARAL